MKFNAYCIVAAISMSFALPLSAGNKQLHDEIIKNFFETILLGHGSKCKELSADRRAYNDRLTVGKAIVAGVETPADVAELYPQFYTKDATFADPVLESEGVPFIAGLDAIIGYVISTIDLIPDGKVAEGAVFAQDLEGNFVSQYTFLGTFAGNPFVLPSATSLKFVDVCDPANADRYADECTVEQPANPNRFNSQWKISEHRDIYNLAAFGPPPAN